MIAATNTNGGIEEEFSFDAWGRRRSVTNWSDYSEASISYALGAGNSRLFTRGFTFHEHHYFYALINMNGRMYDPVVGRFLSPDNYVQDPRNSQSYNRYSYCLNNPLKYTDPSGYTWGIFKKSWWEKNGRQVIATAASIVVTAAVTVLTGGNIVAAGWAGGFVGGLINSKGDIVQALNGGAMGIVGAVASFAVAQGVGALLNKTYVGHTWQSSNAGDGHFSQYLTTNQGMNPTLGKHLFGNVGNNIGDVFSGVCFQV